jgi:hypothetical protein
VGNCNGIGEIVAKDLDIGAIVQHGRCPAATVVQLKIVRRGVQCMGTGIDTSTNTHEDCTNPACLLQHRSSAFTANYFFVLFITLLACASNPQAVKALSAILRSNGYRY